jgi:hypothetical protein
MQASTQSYVDNRLNPTVYFQNAEGDVNPAPDVGGQYSSELAVEDGELAVDETWSNDDPYGPNADEND